MSIESRYAQAQVTSSKQVADRISGSLVDAANLTRDLGLVLSVVAAAAAFALAALLALSSVGKRVRELGTLKALGWTQRRVVRQVAGESLAQGILGGIAGVALGLLAAVAHRRLRADADRKLDLRRRQHLRDRPGGADHLAVRLADGTDRGRGSCCSGFSLAVLGGLLAGAAAALRAARLRPADALRTVE